MSISEKCADFIVKYREKKQIETTNVEPIDKTEDRIR